MNLLIKPTEFTILATWLAFWFWPIIRSPLNAPKLRMRALAFNSDFDRKGSKRSINQTLSNLLPLKMRFTENYILIRLDDKWVVINDYSFDNGLLSSMLDLISEMTLYSECNLSLLRFLNVVSSCSTIYEPMLL